MNGPPVQKSGRVVLLAVAAVVCVPATAHAHVGAGPVHDVFDGLAHPFSGLDHLCAIVAVGIWAAQRGGRATWLVPLTFLLVMMIGGAVAMAGGKLPLIEPGIVLSLVVLGALIAAGVRLPLAACVAIVGLFALVHGYAHGQETPAGAARVSYAVGFVLTTAFLLAAGIVFDLSMQRVHKMQIVRVAGAAIALCGVWLSIR